MAWRDDLRPGSFRGVPFQVDGHRLSGGRRLDVHEYPGRDLPWAEDLGRRAQLAGVDAYVIGPDYMAARDALKAALDAEGPGELIHPWLGALTVAVMDWTLSESTADGGEALFSIGFMEAGALSQPAIAADHGAAAQAAARAAQAQAAADFTGDFDVAQQPGFVLDGALARLSAAGEAIRSAAEQVMGRGAALADFVRRLERFSSELISLARAPGDMAFAALDLVRSVRRLAGTPRAALAALSPLMSFGSALTAALGLTPARRRDAANQTAIANLIRRAAAAEVVAVVSEIDFASYDEAVALRDSVAERLDALALEAADAGDDASWRSLETLRQALVRDVTARGGSLARLTTARTASGEPALVLAHRLYGPEPDRDLELAARNRVRHPGFLPTRPLQVLTPEAARG